MAIYVLENTIQKYDWGSPSALPEFLGVENATGQPWAELWMGAHPKAPSIAIDPATGKRTPLDELIAADPVSTLGEATSKRFSGKLPFLFKLLSADKPLSIQAHPSKRKAERGFEREELAGIPLDAPERNYKDPNHKPETIVAISRFEGLCGFRPIADIVDDIKVIAPHDWERIVGRLVRNPGKLELSVFFYTFISLIDERKDTTLSTARARIERILDAEGGGGQRGRILSRVLMLMDAYPGDIGAFTPMVLNLFCLEPGQAINLAAGEAHAYLSGMGAEIMANSDNVLRGGLTTKHIDIPEFISVLGFDSVAIEPIVPVATGDGFFHYPCAAPDYSLSKAVIDGTLDSKARAHIPAIVMCTSGSIELSTAAGLSVPLKRGSSVFITADEGGYALSGSGELFKASVPS